MNVIEVTAVVVGAGVVLYALVDMAYPIRRYVIRLFRV